MDSRKRREHRPLYHKIPPQAEEIRLIVLHPPTRSFETIDCSLIYTSLRNCPDYEALSYEWGKPDSNKKSVIIDGQRFPVRQNLWDALMCLRNIRTDRVLWIDALCINQSDPSEVNHQLRQAGQIYFKAWRTIIWLGVESYNSKIALDFITFIGRDWENRSAELAEYSHSYSALNAVKDLCSRPYWDRLWIVQEVVKSRSAIVQCGSDFATWDDFSDFCFGMDSDYTSERYPVLGSRFVEKLLNTSAFTLERYQAGCRENGVCLKNLLAAFSTSGCTEMQDKIYALVGLANDTSELPVDRAKTIFEIFLDVVLLQRFNDCGTIVAFSQFLQWLFQGEVKSSIPDSIRHPVLLIGALGYKTGKVWMVGPGYFDHSYKDLEEMESEANGSSWSYMEQLIDNRAERPRKEIDHNIAGVVRPIKTSLAHGIPGNRPLRQQSYLGNESSQEEEWSQLRPARQSLRPRRDTNPQRASRDDPVFFVDDQGYIGVASENIREEDSICRFPDTDIVAIVRWKADRFEFVGRAIYPNIEKESVPMFSGATVHYKFDVWRTNTRSDFQKAQDQDGKRTLKVLGGRRRIEYEPTSVSFWLDPWTLQELTEENHKAARLV